MAPAYMTVPDEMIQSPATIGRSQFLLLMAFVLLTRLPFLWAGYGDDGDAWRVAEAAHHIAETGTYTASRLPGYPLHEYVAATLIRFGPAGLNLLSAIMSALAVLFFALVLRRLHCRDVIPASVAFALVPVFYIDSISGMDFALGIAFMLAAFWLVLERRFLLAGILMGMAIGSRMTWGAMLLPLLILSFDEGHRPRFGKAQVGLVVPALLIGALWFLPVWMEYGTGLFWFADMMPPLIYILYLPTVGFWGVIGIITLSILLIARWIRGRGVGGEHSLGSGLSAAVSLRLLIASMTALILYLFAFIRLPHDSSYLLPTLPFVLILLAFWLSRRAFLILCLALSLSPFLLMVDNHGVYLAGPVLHDHQERLEQIEYVERVLEQGEKLEGETVVVAGNWLYKILGVQRERNRAKKVEFVYLLDFASVADYRKKGMTTYYLPKQENYNRDVYGVNLWEEGARPFPADSSGN